MTAYARSVYQQAYLYTGDRSMAEDVTQSVFLSAYRHLDALESPRAWLGQATRNASRNMLRGHRRGRTEELPEDLADPNSDPARTFREMDVLRAILALPADLREVIVLVYYEDRSTRDAAAILRTPAGTVRSRLTRARRILRTMLEEGDHAENP